MKSKDDIRRVVEVAYQLSPTNENVRVALDNLVEIVESEKSSAPETDENDSDDSFSNYIVTVGGYVAVLGILAFVIMFAGMRFAGHW